MSDVEQDLEHHFSGVIDDLDLPDVDVVDAVLGRLGDDDAARAGAGLRWLAAAALIVVVAVAGLLAVSPTRAALADWFGIGATELIVEPAEDAALIDGTTLDVLEGTTVESTLDALPLLGSPAQVILEDSGAQLFLWEPSTDLPAIGDSNAGAILRVRDLGRDEALVVTKGAVVGEFEWLTIETEVGPADALHIATPHRFEPAPALEGVQAQPVIIWVIEEREYRLEASIDRDALVRLAENVQVGTDLLPPG